MPQEKHQIADHSAPISTDQSERLIGALDDVSYEAYVLNETINDLRQSVDLLVQQNTKHTVASRQVVHVQSMPLDPCSGEFQINQSSNSLSEEKQPAPNLDSPANHQPELW